MDNRRRPDPEVLPAKVAERVLKRASELEAARAAGTGVADLRAAAAEAGISVEAFDAALGEVRDAEAAVPSKIEQKYRRRARLLGFVGGVAALVVAAAIVVIPRLVVSSSAPVEIAVQNFRLNCLPSDDALSLVRPQLGDNGTVAVSPDKRVLTVRGTPQQIHNVQSVLNEHDGASCARR